MQEYCCICFHLFCSAYVNEIVNDGFDNEDRFSGDMTCMLFR